MPDEHAEQIRITGERARAILGDPLVGGFLEKQIAASYAAFEVLPIGFTLDEVKEVWHHLKAARNLQDSLKAYVVSHEAQIQEDQIDKERQDEQQIPEDYDVNV